MCRSIQNLTRNCNGRVLAGVLLGFLAGCEGSGDGSSPDARLDDGPLAQDAAVALEAASSSETPSAASPYCTSTPALASVTDLSGTWVARMVASQIVNAPIVGALHIKTIYYFLANVAQNGTQVVLDGRYCDRIEIDPATSLAPVTIPAPWAHTETLVHRTGSFAAGADGYPVLTLRDPLDSVEVMGAVLASPSDPLPSDPADPRVRDADNDGNPGLTIRIGGMVSGSMYAVQRQTTMMTAIVVAPDRVEGALAFSSEQNVLASDNPTVAALYRQSTTTPDYVACNSSFSMVRVSGGASDDGGAMDGGETDGGGSVHGGAAPSCAWVRANELMLFPAP